jgi:Ca2+-binding RTX toxin-like protein
VFGRGGDDKLTGGTDADILDGGTGNDTLFGGDGDDVLHGGAKGSHGTPLGGDDILNGGRGADILDGGDGFDRLDGGAGADILSGGDGEDTASYQDATAGVSIDLARASTTWTGDAQGDVLTSIERFTLSSFADIFRGDNTANSASAGAGDDQLNGMGGDDVLTGGEGNDTILGGEGMDRILGDGFRGSGDDYLQGNGGDDTLIGGRGNDKMVGGTGSDILEGDSGGDFLIGNEGADIFRYTAVEESQLAIINAVGQQDQIADFTQGEDKIDLSAIDANTALGGDQAFSFLADPAGHTGDWSGLVWEVTDARGITTIFASNDGDADAEMQIFMSHGYTFTAGDFIL